MLFVNLKRSGTYEFPKKMKTEIFMGKRFLHQVIDILRFSLQFKN